MLFGPSCQNAVMHGRLLGAYAALGIDVPVAIILGGALVSRGAADTGTLLAQYVCSH